jgi:hypothetical protein
MAAFTDPTHFLNVDLDIFSDVSLAPLVAALGKRVIVLYVGREGSQYGAHLELASAYRKNADAHLRAFVRLIQDLPLAPRRLWQRARRREFNIGIEAGSSPRYHELRLRSQTLEAVARVGGSVVITTYAPTRTPVVRRQGGSRRTGRPTRA